MAALFHADSHWRDVLALTWQIDTVSGRDAVVRELTAHADRAGPTSFALDPGRTPPRQVTRAGTKAIEAIFKFETTQGVGSGVLRLAPDTSDGNALKAWTLLTALDELKGFEERTGKARPTGAVLLARFPRPQLARPSASRPPPTPTGTRPCWWSAAARPGCRSPRA